ncbi:MAG: hypothetical protein ACERKU_06850, partial [Nitrospirota bacterium]
GSRRAGGTITDDQEIRALEKAGIPRIEDPAWLADDYGGEGANHLVNSPEVQEAVHNLNAALGNVEKLTEGMDKRVNRLQFSVEKTLAKARQALELADPNSPAAVNLNSALKELSAAARSIRVLADYLEQHPEALVKGKK